MKKFLALLLTILFLANTLSMSAFAITCPQNETLGLYQEKTQHMTGNVPCHELQSETPSSDSDICCDGTCLHCHALPLSLVNYSSAPAAPYFGKAGRFIPQDKLSSFNLLPPRRPPKHLS